MSQTQPSNQGEVRQTKFQRPPGSVHILLVRHGESAAAVPGVNFADVAGHGNPELHPEGEKQAIKIGERLRHEPIDAIYVSNLIRTSQTAAPLCKHLGMEPIVEPDFREVFLGEWEGGVLRIKEREQDPTLLNMRSEQRWDVIPGAETNEHLRERVMRGINKVRSQHPDQLVVVVAHGGVIAQIMEIATDCRYFAFAGADNASLTQLVVSEERIWVRGYNDVSHLQ